MAQLVENNSTVMTAYDELRRFSSHFSFNQEPVTALAVVIRLNFRPTR